MPHSLGVLSHEKEIRPHMAGAINKPSPLEATARARPSPASGRAICRRAQERAISPCGGSSEARGQARCVQIATRPEMQACERRLNAFKSAALRRVAAPSARLSLPGALMLACGLPDASFVPNIVAGFASVGDYGDSGWFRPEERAALRDSMGSTTSPSRSACMMRSWQKRRAAQRDAGALARAEVERGAREWACLRGSEGQGYTH